MCDSNCCVDIDGEESKVKEGGEFSRNSLQNNKLSFKHTGYQGTSSNELSSKVIKRNSMKRFSSQECMENSDYQVR